MRWPWSWKSHIEAAEASARDAAALLEESTKANRDADPLVADLTRMHRENHFAIRIAEAFRLQAGGPNDHPHR